jgi:hypothetical protein
VIAGTDLFGSGPAKYAGVVGGIAAAAVTFLAPGQSAEEHRVAAADWEGLDREAINFAEAHVSATHDIPVLLGSLDRLVEQANDIGEKSPNIVPWMYSLATHMAGRKRPATLPSETAVGD